MIDGNELLRRQPCGRCGRSGADCDDVCAKLAAAQAEAARLKSALVDAFEGTRAPVAQVTPTRRQTLDEQDETHRLLSYARARMLESLNASDAGEALLADVRKAREALEWADECFETLIEAQLIYDCDETTENRAPIRAALESLAKWLPEGER